MLGLFAKWKAPRFILTPLLLAYSKFFKLNLDEAQLNFRDYTSLNNLFTRALKNKARVLEHEEDIIISPVDGRILNFGKIKQGTLFKRKVRYVFS